MHVLLCKKKHDWHVFNDCWRVKTCKSAANAGIALYASAVRMCDKGTLHVSMTLLLVHPLYVLEVKNVLQTLILLYVSQNSRTTDPKNSSKPCRASTTAND